MMREGLELVSEAVRLDTAGDHKGALDKYYLGCERLMHAYRFDKVEPRKKMLGERIAGYLNRAEQLKAIVSPAPSTPGGTAVAERPPEAGGGGGGAGGGGAGEDPEKAKMRGALAGAIVMEKPNVKWDDVAGLDGAKDLLKEAVILPYRFPQLFTGKRRPWKGILLYGPPGTGKSYLAKAVATEADSTFFSVSSSDLVSKWQGESEKLVRSLFEMAREAGKAIIFIDEIDSLCSSRSEGENDSTRRIKTEFLVQMQGVGKAADGILVLGATNIPWDIDSAMRRRFEKRVYIALPEFEARKDMFRIHIGDTGGVSLSEHELDALAEMTEGFSGSDISVAVRDVLMEPIRKCQDARYFRLNVRGKYTPAEPCGRCPPPGTPAGDCPSCRARPWRLMDVPSELLEVPELLATDFERVVRRSKASVGPEDLERFRSWTAEFGEEGS